MKKVVGLVIAVVLLVGSFCGCASESVSERKSVESKVSQKLKDIDGYEYAVYDKFNSYAEDNGLKDTPIYVRGTVKSVFDFDDSCKMSIKSSDNERWLASFDYVDYSELASTLFDEQEVTCFGIYGGYSDVFLMPVIHLDKVQVGSKTYTAEDINEDDLEDDLYFFDDEDEEETTEQTTTTVPQTTKAKSTESKGVNKLIYNDNNVKAYYIGKEIDEDGDQKINLRIENNSNKDLTVTTMNVSVNGYVVNPIFRVDIPSGKKANEPIYFMDYVLEDNKISNINELEFSLHFFDTNSSITDDNVYRFTSDSILIKF